MTHNEVDLSNFLTVKKVVEQLGLAEGSIYRMVSEGRLDAHRATEAEIAALFVQGAIQGVPGTGILLISRDSVATVRTWKRVREAKQEAHSKKNVSSL